MTTELKPCPFCGGEAHHTTYKDAYKAERHNVECMICGAEAGYGDATGGLSWTTKDAAYKQWNTRAGLEQVAQLKKDVALLARELDNTLGALICKESYQDEYLDANLSRLEFLVVKHSKKEEVK